MLNFLGGYEVGQCSSTQVTVGIIPASASASVKSVESINRRAESANFYVPQSSPVEFEQGSGRGINVCAHAQRWGSEIPRRTRLSMLHFHCPGRRLIGVFLSRSLALSDALEVSLVNSLFCPLSRLCLFALQPSEVIMSSEMYTFGQAREEPEGYLVV